MLILYQKKNSQSGIVIQEQLDNMVLAYKTKVVYGSTVTFKDSDNTYQPPLLVDGKKCIEGVEAIQVYLEKLRSFKDEWDKFQSDSCYCDDDGNIE